MERRRSKRFYFKTGRGEQLENRNMLSGHPLMVAFSPFGFEGRAAAREAFGHFGSAVAGLHSSAAHGTTLTATLTDSTNPTATGTVSYQTGGYCGNSTTSLTVSVSGEAANTALNITIGGVVIGTLTTDATGAGTVTFSSNPTGSQRSLPSNFPTTIAAGTAVTVGPLSGSFATATTKGGGDGDSFGCNHSATTTLTASLTDSTSSATGTATFTSSKSHGATTSSLTVSVTGAAASSSLDVVVNGTTVGTLTTDSTGAGALTLSSGLPTISSGSTMTVGTLSGTFASSNGSTLSLSSLIHFLRRR
jgi:hypothetical protein